MKLVAVLLVICVATAVYSAETCDHQGCVVDEGRELVCRAEDVECTSWILMPGWNSLPRNFRIFAYSAALIYCFLGIAVVADIFMAAIEQITSKEYVVTRVVEGRTTEVRYKVWNSTIANLSLLALGTSAPEILLAVIDTVNNLAPACSSVEQCQDADHAQVSPQLGASTIVGSAAFNLCMISAVCMMSVPRGEVRRIEDYGVFLVTAFFSLLAYVWLYYVLGVRSKDTVDLAEAGVTLGLFPTLLLFAWLQSRNWFCSSRTSGFAELNNVELRDMTEKSKIISVEKKLLEQKRNGDVSALAIVEEAAAPVDPLMYRINATRRLAGKRRVIPQHELALVIPEFEPTPKASAGVIEFLVGDVAVLEQAGFVTLTIERKHGFDGEVAVQCLTTPGTATADVDYQSINQIVTFGPGEKQKTVQIRIIEDDEVETDETFFVVLSQPTGGAQLGPQQVCTVTIIDNDSPGVLQFKAPTASIEEDAGILELEVVRTHGSAGRVMVDYRTVGASAVSGKDFEQAEGNLIFENGEARKVIQIRIIDNEIIDEDRLFSVILFNPKGQTVAPLLGPDRGCVVTIVDNDHTKQMAIKIVDLIEAREDQMRVETSTWAEQFREAVTLSGEVDLAGRALPPSMSDYVLHLATLGWKILFAFIPPTCYLGGWATFVVSLIFIGMITAIVAEFATLFGCVVGISDSITALTLVAVGTSLPDTFASRQATRDAPNADAAIGNITGSNSVNVFLGLGLPWMIATVYHHYYRKDTYTMPAGDLGYSVLIFLIAATGALVIFTLKRMSCLGGGELGGGMFLRTLSALILTALWVGYVVLASLNAANV